jgi:hypothetical protein
MGGQSPHIAHFLEERNGVLETSVQEARRWGWSFDLTRPELVAVAKDQLERLDRVLSDPAATELQGRILQAMSLYAGGLLFEGVEHRLLHALVSVESLLLKNENEPIMFALSQRVAHCIGKSLAERREIVSDIKGAYKVRSDFVHHGKSAPHDQVELVNQAVRWCWVCVYGFFIDRRINAKEVRDKNQMVTEIDDKILS